MRVTGKLVPIAPAIEHVAAAGQLVERRLGIAGLDVQRVARFAELGDLNAGIDDAAHSLQPLLDMYERDEAEGEGGDMPYPPDYPKMPGEPKRVQPSRDRDR